MAFSFVVLAAALVCAANAGLIGAPVAYSPAAAVSTSYIHQAAAPVAYAQAAPVAYAQAAPLAYAQAAPVAVHAPSIGASHQSVVRSLGGNQAVSHYTKAVDSAFSSVRKFDTRVTNDGLTVAAAPVAYAHAAPVVSAYATHAAPVVSAYAAHAPAAVAYSPAAVVSHATFTGLGASYAW